MSPRQTGKKGPDGPDTQARPRGDGRAGHAGRGGSVGSGGSEGRGGKDATSGRAERTTRDGRGGGDARSGREAHGGRAGGEERDGRSGRAKRPEGSENARRGAHAGRPDQPGKAPSRGAPRPGTVSPSRGAAPAGSRLGWTREGRLFPAPGPEIAAALTDYEALLKTVMPLRISHARELPSAIHSLSASLTSERGAGPKPGYLSDPRMLAAYAWYFLPWNLYRLTRLLRGLDLDLPDGATVVDAGSGPLTLVQALWIAAPRLRSRRLTFVCLDRSRAALALGREMFLGLAGEDSPWRVEAVREELPRLPRGVAHLVTAVNVLNELTVRRSQSMSDKTALLAHTLSGALVSGGRMLLVEPGVRASGKLLSRLRENLMEDEGLSLLAPCPHAGPCPLAARGTGTWCHFTVDAVGVPKWLEALSKRAGLPKRDVSLSFLFAGDQAVRADAALGRVVSNPFPAPGREGEWARYACAAGGLRLYVTPSRGGLVPGDLARTQRPEHPPRDKKSGASFYILEAPPQDPRQAQGGQAALPDHAKPRNAAPGTKRPPQGADLEKRPSRGADSEKRTPRGASSEKKMSRGASSEKKPPRGAPGAKRSPQGAGGPKKAASDAPGGKIPSRRPASPGTPPRKAPADRKKTATGGRTTPRRKDGARDAD